METGWLPGEDGMRNPALTGAAPAWAGFFSYVSYPLGLLRCQFQVSRHMS